MLPYFLGCTSAGQKAPFLLCSEVEKSPQLS